MGKLVRLLKTAHAIEVGAYNAYEGHWRSIKPLDNPVRGQIKFIQVDELIHKEQVEKMLTSLHAKPNKALDFVFWCIGKSVSISCYIFGYRAALFGAKVMETMGTACYAFIAKVAREQGREAMAAELEEMQKKEDEHEKYFQGLLNVRNN